MDQRKDAATDEATGPSLGAPTDKALAWFARLRGEDVSAAERAAFDAWLSADPAHREAYRRVTALWDSAAFGAALRRQAASPPRPAPPPERRRPRWRAAVAAAAALALLAVGIDQAGDLAIALRADHRTATGERERVVLADGSVMVLNTGSAVALDFAPDRRRIRLLAGEAYFEVVTDPARPFEVASDGATVRVVGTAFAVRTAGPEVRVTVRRGQVAVTGTAEPARAVRLGRGEQVAVSEGRPGPKTRVDSEAVLAWLEGRLVIHRRPLGAVVDELRRHHPGWIVVADGRLGGVEVSGNYRLDDPAAVAAALAAATSAELVRVSDYLLILR